jgi:hypothetical protein
MFVVLGMWEMNVDGVILGNYSRSYPWCVTLRTVPVPQLMSMKLDTYKSSFDFNPVNGMQTVNS